MGAFATPMPRRRLICKRALLTAAAVLLVAPLVWLATSHQAITQVSLQRFQVRLNFAALIDWSAASTPLLPDAPCSETLGIETVALMFLTTGLMPHERSWRLWLEGAAGWLPYQGIQAAQAAVCGDAARRQQLGRACPPAWQHLYKLYVHALPNFTGKPRAHHRPAARLRQRYDAGSVFHGKLVPFRVVTIWGDMSLVVAERLLLQAALQDASNSRRARRLQRWTERFLLISDSGIPLYDPLTFYQQLMHEDKSRVKGCRVGFLSDYRWHPVMALKGLRRSQWRKSSQWFGLLREHAELVVNDQEIYNIFDRYCHGEDRRRRVECYPDEHYIPTLLSLRGLENETYCGGHGLAATNWSWGGAHPRSWRSREIKPWLLGSLRTTGPKSRLHMCNDTSIIQDSQKMFLPLRPVLEAADPGQACQLLKESAKGVVTTYERPMSGDCPLTARKFPKFTMVAVNALMRRTCLLGVVDGNCTGIKAAAVLQTDGTPAAVT